MSGIRVAPEPLWADYRPCDRLIPDAARALAAYGHTMRIRIACVRGAWILAGVLAIFTRAASSVSAALGAPVQAVRTAMIAARSHFHTSVVDAEFGVVSRRDRSWALVDGTATTRHRLWAGWLHRDQGRTWQLRYFDTTAPFQPQSSRRGRVPCDLYPAFSEARCPPGAPAAAHIRADLLEQLVPRGAGATIEALLRAGSYSFSFDRPVNGSASIVWVQAGGGQRTAGVPMSAVIARGTAELLSGRPGRMTIRLTSAGRRVLGAATAVRLTAKGTFTPILYAAVSATRDFTLHR